MELVAQHYTGDEMAPYERLLGDAMRGDATLFAREDALEAAWRVVDPVLNNPSPVHEYDQNSWGPGEVELLPVPPGGWHNPEPSQDSPQYRTTGLSKYRVRHPMSKLGNRPSRWLHKETLNAFYPTQDFGVGTAKTFYCQVPPKKRYT